MGRPQPIHESVQAKYGNTPEAQEKRSAIAQSRTMRREGNVTYINEDETRRGRIAANTNTAPRGKKQNKKESVAVRGAAKISITARTFVFIWPATGLYIGQLFCALLFIYAYSKSSAGGIVAYVLTYALPLEQMYTFGWLGATFFGVITMILGLMAYTASGAKMYNTRSMTIFAICIAAYFTPYLFLFPWVALWIMSLLYDR